MISKQQLQYFLSVCKEGTLSKAADKLNITQPSLSVAIKEMENILGAQLFIRHRKGVTPTQSGKTLQTHCKKLLEYWDEVKASVQDVSQEISGQFIIGCPSLVGQYCLPRFTPNLLQKYPKLDLIFKSDHSKMIYDALVNQEIDIGIVVNPLPREDLVIHRLYFDKTAFWTYKKNKLLINRKTNCFYHPDLSQSRELLKKLKKDILYYFKLIPCDSLQIITEIINREEGIGMLPKTLAQSYKNLIEITSLPAYTDEICLIYRKESSDRKGIQKIVKAIRVNCSLD